MANWASLVVAVTATGTAICATIAMKNLGGPNPDLGGVGCMFAAIGFFVISAVLIKYIKDEPEGSHHHDCHKCGRPVKLSHKCEGNNA